MCALSCVRNPHEHYAVTASRECTMTPCFACDAAPNWAQGYFSCAVEHVGLLSLGRGGEGNMPPTPSLCAC